MCGYEGAVERNSRKTGSPQLLVFANHPDAGEEKDRLAMNGNPRKLAMVARSKSEC